jgi:hypothetical protein
MYFYRVCLFIWGERLTVVGGFLNGRKFFIQVFPTISKTIDLPTPFIHILQPIVTKQHNVIVSTQPILKHHTKFETYKLTHLLSK